MSESTAVNGTTTGSRAASIVKIVLVIAVVVGLLLAGKQATGAIQGFAEWVQGLGLWGPLVFILGYAVATVAFLPGSVLTLAAGAIFGLGWGTAWAFLGALLGSSGSFLVARYLARAKIEQKVAGNARFSAIDRAIARDGWKFVALLRLSPVLPFNLLNYALGLTRIGFWGYLAGSLAMLPGTLLYVYYGSVAGSLAAVASGSATSNQGVERWIMLGVGLLATLGASLFLARRAKQAIAAAERDGAQEDGTQEGIHRD